MTPSLAARPSRSPGRRSPRRAGAVALGLAAVLAAPAVAASGADTVDDRLPTDVARDWLVQEAPALGLTRADVTDLRVTDAYSSAHNGVSHVYLQQLVDGVPVVGSSVTVNVARDGEVVHAGSRLLARVAERSSGRAVLTPAAAVAAAARGLGLAAPTGLRVLGSTDGNLRGTLLTDGGISAKPIPATLAYQALEDGTARLAWQLEIELPTEDHWYLVAVDAETGRLLATEDLVEQHAPEDVLRGVPGTVASPVLRRTAPSASFAEAAATDGSSYRVYAQPLESPNDGPRTLVTNPADPFSSPFGWHDTDGKAGADTTTTRGNNVNAYADTVVGVKNSADPLSQPDGGAGLDFDHAVDHSQPAVAHRDAAVTNLFYWNNIVHDFLARFGFDEAAGNFQVTNYTGQGRGGDAVNAEAQDGSGVNNANFATPAEGSAPRMQMFLWPAPAGRLDVRDGDFDAGVVAHEYGHGVSNRLTGGPSKVSCLSGAEQMGEGWSDFMSYVHTMRAGDDGATPRGIGTYVLFQADRKQKGIRITPYSTDKKVNPSTYDTIKTAAAPHGVGYVWATMLYDVYWGLVAKHGFNPDLDGDWTTGGNNLAVQLVMDGMKFQPCRPGFVDGRDAILAADRALTGGENACEIWQGFARRGLGVGAKQNLVTDKTDGVQSFAVPADC